MKIAFPTDENKGLDSIVYAHFGSAPTFVIVDMENGSIETIENPDIHHEHGRCQPLAALAGRPVSALVVGGIGAGALNKLSLAGMEIYRAIEGTILENLELIKTGTLPQFSMGQTCAGHDHKSNCAH